MDGKEIVLERCQYCRQRPVVQRKGPLKRIACIHSRCHVKPKAGWRYKLSVAKRTWNIDVTR